MHSPGLTSPPLVLTSVEKKGRYNQCILERGTNHGPAGLVVAKGIKVMFFLELEEEMLKIHEKTGIAIFQQDNEQEML